MAEPDRVVVPSLRIVGRVLDPSGMPIDGANWRFVRYADGERATTRGSADSDGHFSVSAGSHSGSLYLTAPGYQSHRIKCQPEPPHAVLAHGEFRLEPAGCLRVRFPDQFDLEAEHGWSVRVSKENRRLSPRASFDPQTREAILEHLPEGLVDVSLKTADGGDIGCIRSAAAEVVLGEARLVEFPLDWTDGKIRLNLSFAWERFAESSGLNSHDSSFIVRDEKRYGYAPEVRLTQGSKEIPVENRHYLTWSFGAVDPRTPVELAVLDEAIEPHSFTIQPYAETTILVRGRSAIRFEVIDAKTRQPVDTASIKLLRGRWPMGPWTPLDASGVIDALPPEQFGAWVRAEGYVNAGTQIEELAIGETRRVVVELHRNSTITGRLTSGGRGLASVSVALHRREEDGSWKSQTSTGTDGNGNYVLQASQAGSHRLSTTWSDGATSEPFQIRPGESYGGFDFDLAASAHLTVELGELPEELQKNHRLHLNLDGRWIEGHWLQFHPHSYRGLTPGTIKIVVTDGSFSPHEDERKFELQQVVQLEAGEHKTIKIDPVVRPAHVELVFEGQGWSKGKWSTGFFASADAIDIEELHDPYPIESTQRVWTYGIASGTWYLFLRSEDGKHEIRFPEPVSVKGGETKRLHVREILLSEPDK